MAPDLYTIIDDDLMDDVHWKHVEYPPQSAVPESGHIITESAPKMDIIPKFKDDAAGDYLNALPLADVDSADDDEEEDEVPREGRSRQSSKRQRAGVSPVVGQGQFVSVHSAQEPAQSAHFFGTETSGRVLLAGVVTVWLAICGLFLCLKQKCVKQDVMEKDGAVMVKVEDESDESCDEPDEYVTTPEPPLMQRMEEDV